MITSQEYKERHSQLMLEGETTIVQLLTKLEPYLTYNEDIKQKELVIQSKDSEYKYTVIINMETYSIISIFAKKYEDETLPCFLCKNDKTNETDIFSIYDMEFPTELLFEFIYLLEKAILEVVKQSENTNQKS